MHDPETLRLIADARQQRNLLVVIERLALALASPGPIALYQADGGANVTGGTKPKRLD